MRIVIFFICMCLLLLSGGNYAAAPAHQNSIHHLESKPQVKFIGGKQSAIVITDNSFNDQTEYLIEEEDEDENVNRAIARKCTMLNKCYLHAFLLTDSNQRCNASRPFYSLLSNKYISQRTLRI